jgi:hypothetical protein
MRSASIGFAAVLMLGSFAGPLAAQQVDAAAPAPAAQPSPAIDASKLPLNLSRLHQKLKASTETRRPGLSFNVDVIAQAPRIQLFTPEDDLRYGPVPNATPTHREMLEVATPREFRSPVMDFNSLMRWIQSTLKRED